MNRETLLQSLEQDTDDVRGTDWFGPWSESCDWFEPVDTAW